MKNHRRATCVRHNPRIFSFGSLRLAGPLLPAIALLFLGCAASPERDTSNPFILGNLDDIRARGFPDRNLKLVLVSLPDRVYEVPLSSAPKTVVGMSKTAGSVEPTLNKGGAAAAPRERINVALFGSPSVVPSLIEPPNAFAAKTDQPHDGWAVQAVAMAAERPETQALAQRLDASPEKQAIKQRAVAAQVAAPKLKFDTDYESVQHAVKFAFDQSALGPQAQVLMAKILPDAKVATQIKLTGFSDGIGSRLANERVANARAMSIRNELVRNDVEPSKITVAPAVVMGVPKTKQPSSQYANYRRVDVDITKPKQPQVISLNDR